MSLEEVKIGVQFEVASGLNWDNWKTLVEVCEVNGFDAIFPVNPNFGRRLAQFKSSDFDAFGNISHLVAQRLGYGNLPSEGKLDFISVCSISI